MSRPVVAALACWIGAIAPAHAQIVLTLEETLTRAREQSGAVALARARVAEADAAVIDASVRFRENPVIETGLGPRRGGGTTMSEIDVSVSQQFETGGQRQARIGAARAAVDRQRAEVTLAARDGVFAAASAFLAGVAAADRLRLAGASADVSRRLLAATDRRFAAGDVAAIDLNLARIDAARAEAAVQSARTDLAAVADRLRILLRLPAADPIELRGSLEPTAIPPLEQLESMVSGRPELAVLAADAREADAQIQLGRAQARPDLGVQVAYQREETDTIVMGGLTVTLPAFQMGQGAVASGMARATRIGLEAELARQRALGELRSAYALHAGRVALVQMLARDALPSVADNEALAQRSYEAGEMSLMDLLLVQRHALDVRLLVIERQLEAAQARLDVDFASGELR